MSLRNNGGDLRVNRGGLKDLRISGKRGAIGHIEIMIAFAVFIGFVFFLFYVFNPFKKSGISEGAERIIEEIIWNNVSIKVVTMSLILNTSNPGYPEGFMPCFVLGGETSYVSTGFGNSDVVITTDLSDTMNFKLIDNTTGVARDCNSPDLYNDTTKRISLVKCLVKSAIKTILNVSGNRVALVGYYGDNGPPEKGRVYDLGFTNDTSLLYAEIDKYGSSYPLSGGTCICCSINDAYQLFSERSDNTRKKFVLSMSDGIPTHTCGSEAAATKCSNIRTGRHNDEGLYLGASGCHYQNDACEGSACKCASDNANWSACRLNKDKNATIYSIGFGPIGKCPLANYTLREIANCGKGEYLVADNGTKLAEIYDYLSREVAQAMYYFEPARIDIPAAYSVVAGTYENEQVDANYSGEISVKYNSSYYSLFFSDKFNQSGVGNESCVHLGPGNYSMGLTQERVFIFYDYLRALAVSYYEDYNELKSRLRIPPGIDFGFIVRDTQGKIIFRAINRKATKVDVFAKDIPIEVIDSKGRIQNLIMNVQVW